MADSKQRVSPMRTRASLPNNAIAKADPETKQLYEMVNKHLDIAGHMRTVNGGEIRHRYNVEKNCLEVRPGTNGEWIAVGGPAQAAAAPAMRNVVGADGSLYHSSLAGREADDHAHYLNNVRHDLTARHALGTVVPHDALANLTDVVITSPADSEVLTWDAATSRFKNKPASGTPGAAVNYQELMEQTLEELLTGVLSTGDATESTVTYTFGDASTDNNGIASWSPSWTSNAGNRSNTLATAYVELTVRTIGTHDIVLGCGVTTAGRQFCAVTLDGVAQTTWNQGANLTYTLSGVGAGPHTIRVTAGGLGTYVRLASIVIYQLPYQGVAVPGDALEAVYIPPWMLVTSVGIGPTDNGATINSSYYGETIITKLPRGTALAESVFARSPVVAGAASSGGTGIVRTPIVSSRLTTSPLARGFLKTGVVFTIQSTAGTRGYTVGADSEFEEYGYTLSATIYRLAVRVMLGKVTATGTGSVLTVGQYVLFVIGVDLLATSSTTGSFGGVPGTFTGASADIYVIPT